jgi:hypothetical protein
MAVRKFENILEDQDLDYIIEEDYRRIVKAVFDSAMVDYTKLQHVKNRNKKFLQQSYLDVIAMFFNKNFIFEHFHSLEDGSTKLSFPDLLKYFLKKNKIDMEKIHTHIADHSMEYWWEKNFHDLQVPETISIAGVIWTIKNSPANPYIDYENKRIYCPTRRIGSDRVFFKLCLRLILKSAEITLTNEQMELFFKIFYLFLKINSPLEQYKK